MAATERITMTMREVDRLRTIQSVVDGMLMTRQAAERLHLSRRQVERLTRAISQPGRFGTAVTASWTPEQLSVGKRRGRARVEPDP